MRGSRFLFLLLVLPLVGGCSEVASLDSAEATTACGPNGCFNNDAAVDVGASDVSTDIGNDALSETGSVANPLCGVLICDPDDFEAAKCNTEGDSDGGSSDAPIATPDAGEASPGDAQSEAPFVWMDGGNFTDGAPNSDGGSMGGSMGGSKNPNPDSPQDPPAPDPPDEHDDGPAFACQVVADSHGDRTTTCVPAGAGVDNDPCVTSTDCAPGYACVGDQDTGVCRSYCCLDPEACPDGTHCGVLPSRDALQSAPETEVLLPVCVPANDCELLPGPGGNNRCADALMCAIVRADGTTACVFPGSAGEGEPCGVVEPGTSPCAEGFVCSKATNTCLALCSIGDPDACETGVCQGGTDGIPDEYGVCVGTSR